MANGSGSDGGEDYTTVPVSGDPFAGSAPLAPAYGTLDAPQTALTRARTQDVLQGKATAPTIPLATNPSPYMSPMEQYALNSFLRPQQAGTQQQGTNQLQSLINAAVQESLRRARMRDYGNG